VRARAVAFNATVGAQSLDPRRESIGLPAVIGTGGGSASVPAASTSLAPVALAGLALVSIVFLLGIAVEFSYRHAIEHVMATGFAPSNLAAIDGQRRYVATGIGLGYLLSGIAFIAWFQQAYANLPTLGVSGRRRSNGWAVGAWFVPFLGLVRPFSMAGEAYRGSDPALPDGSPVPEGPVPFFFWAWWSTYLGGNILFGVSRYAENSTKSLSSLHRANLFVIVSYTTLLVAGILAIGVVASIAGRQRTRAAQLREGQLPDDAGPATSPPAQRAIAPVRRPAAPARPSVDLEALRTPGGPACPSCGYGNHPLATGCLSCHRRLG
jgi:hypothetical protein